MEVFCFFRSEVDDAVAEGEQRIVAAALDVLAVVNDAAALTDDDHAATNGGAVSALDAESFGGRVATECG